MNKANHQNQERVGVRLDKWLWAARFFKTRALATEEIGKGRVYVNGQPAKPAKELHVGDEMELRQPGGFKRLLIIKGVSQIRGPASVAQTLYEETPASVEARERMSQARRDGSEPSLALEHGRPTKRDRRQLAQWDRWSASIDPESH